MIKLLIVKTLKSCFKVLCLNATLLLFTSPETYYVAKLFHFQLLNICCAHCKAPLCSVFPRLLTETLDLFELYLYVHFYHYLYNIYIYSKYLTQKNEIKTLLHVK